MASPVQNTANHPQSQLSHLIFDSLLPGFNTEVQIAIRLAGIRILLEKGENYMEAANIPILTGSGNTLVLAPSKHSIFLLSLARGIPGAFQTIKKFVDQKNLIAKTA